MRSVREYFDGAPLRYAVFAIAAALTLFLAARQTPWVLFGSSRNEEAIAFTHGLLQLLWVGLAIAPLLAIRRPIWATLAAALPMVLAPTADDNQWPFVVYLGLQVVAVVAMWRRPRVAVAISLAALAPVLAVATGHAVILVPYGAEIQMDSASGLDASLVLGYLLGTAVVLGVGWSMRWSGQRALVAARLAARASEVEGQAAVTAERARLARDLHDVVAHHVSLIAVRAETAPYTEEDLGEDGRQVLTEIASDARLALDELRGVLGILGRAGAGERAPQPSWADVLTLVERSRSAGIDVRVTGDATGEVEPGIGYAAYRLVQEALTNARRHAPGEQVDLALEATSGLLAIRVANRAAPGRPPGAGHGLAGMRERVESLGGRFGTSVDDGRFVVEATLPRSAVRAGA